MKLYRNRATYLFFEEGKSVPEITKQIIGEFGLNQSFNSVQKNIYNWTKDRGLYEACKAAQIDLTT